MKRARETTELRQKKYLNNIIEQDHRPIKRLVNAGLGFKSFNTARRTLRGYEAMNMIRKGQIKRVVQGDSVGQTNSELRGYKPPLKSLIQWSSIS